MAEAARPPPAIADADVFRAWARGQPEKWQLIEGALVMMAGASRAHVRICSNLTGRLWAMLRGQRCQPYQSDLAVRVDSRNEFYPDIVIDGGPARDEAEAAVVVVEVLSPSTEKDDRRRKWAAYRRLPALQHYLLVAQDELAVELYTRSETGWSLRVFETVDGVVPLDAVGASLRLAEIYEGVDLAPVPEVTAGEAVGG